MISRRTFALAAATAASSARVRGANDRIGVGYIGVGNRGQQVLDSFLKQPDQVTAALCDLKPAYLDIAATKAGNRPATMKDYRHLLEMKEVDAVVIATPDHWHAIQMIAACKAGKDVYVEKPFSLTVVEGRRMVEVAAETRRVVQVGTQRRSEAALREAAAFVREGGIGKVTVARAFHIRNEWPMGIGKLADGPPPDPEEWDAWLGPAPKVPYNPNRTYYRFRWFWDYSGGQMTNFGTHYVDMMRWCCGKEYPKAVTALGGRFAIDDNREIPDTLKAIWDYGDLLMTFSQFNANAAQPTARRGEIEIRGTKGTVYLNESSWEAVAETPAAEPVAVRAPSLPGTPRPAAVKGSPAIEPRSGSGRDGTDAHVRNFLDCVKSRGRCNADPLIGHVSTATTIIGNIAYRVRALLEWDGAAERFTNNAAANERLHYRYRAPYTLG
jgi:predicted dehydrogenase